MLGALSRGTDEYSGAGKKRSEWAVGVEGVSEMGKRQTVMCVEIFWDKLNVKAIHWEAC